MKPIIIKPIITEQSLDDASHGIYTFLVAKAVNKFEIKKAIEDMFKVHVKTVATSTVKGKKRLAGKRRLAVYSSSSKKARVRLGDREKIDLFEAGTKT